MKSKFQKRSALKLADRIILHKHGYNTPQLATELGSRACPGVHTRDREIIPHCWGIIAQFSNNQGLKLLIKKY